MKRFLAIILTMIITLSLCALPVSAASSNKVWDGSVSTSWYTGKKKEYNISKPSQLAGLAKLVNSGYSMEGVVINLTADITMNKTDNWDDWYDHPPKNKFTPIGCTGDPINGYAPFCGLFNGNGHVISGLYVNNYKTAGLFGYLYCGAVTNVIISKSVIIGYDDGKQELINRGCYSGGIAGIAEGSVINQCEVQGKVFADGPSSLASGARDAYSGGIVGSIHTENVSSAMVAGAFASFGVFYNAALFNDGSGGIIKSSGITNCISFAYTAAKSAHNSYCGGIAGWGNNGTIKNCLTLWEPYKDADYSGLIAGGLHICHIVNCYSFDGNNGLPFVGDKYHHSNVNAEKMTNKQIMAKSFPKKLGTSFVYKKNDRPYLSCYVDAKNSSGSSSSSSSSSSSKSSKPTVKVSGSDATISWTKADKAVSYIIYKQKSNGKYTKLGSTTTNKFTMEVKSGTSYTILIKAEYKDGTVKAIPNGKVTFKA